MEKKHIIKFLKLRKRGVYKLIVKLYADVITSMAVTMALEVIAEDLEKESGEKVELNYFSLAQAAAKVKKTIETDPGLKKGTNRFKDANELEEKQTKPGGFKCPQ
jgi:AAA15 family ATPase/GTPase